MRKKVTVDQPAELVAFVSKSELPAEGAQTLTEAFAPHFQEFAELREMAVQIKNDEPIPARAIRLKIKACRVAAEKTRKAQKKYCLLLGNAIDGINAVLKVELVPLEDHLEEIEKAEERREAARIAALDLVRCEELSDYTDPTYFDLGRMPDEAYAELLANSKAALEARQAAERKAEQDRIAAEKAAEEARIKREQEEAAERERIRQENERLAALAEDERKKREAIEAAAEKERIAREKAEAKAQAERDRLAKIEREKREAAEAESARLAKAESDRVAAAEKAEAKRVADEKQAAKKAAAAPDKAKLTAFAAELRAMSAPDMASDPGKALYAQIIEQFGKFADWIESEASQLGGK